MMSVEERLMGQIDIDVGEHLRTAADHHLRVDTLRAFKRTMEIVFRDDAKQPRVKPEVLPALIELVEAILDHGVDPASVTVRLHAALSRAESVLGMKDHLTVKFSDGSVG